MVNEEELKIRIKTLDLSETTMLVIRYPTVSLKVDVEWLKKFADLVHQCHPTWRGVILEEVLGTEIEAIEDHRAELLYRALKNKFETEVAEKDANQIHALKAMHWRAERALAQVYVAAGLFIGKPHDVAAADLRAFVINGMGEIPVVKQHEWSADGESCNNCMIRRLHGELAVHCLEIPQADCPSCGVEQDDLDGIGVLACIHCGYCTHPSTSNGACGICGKEGL